MQRLYQSLIFLQHVNLTPILYDLILFVLVKVVPCPTLYLVTETLEDHCAHSLDALCYLTRAILYLGIN